MENTPINGLAPKALYTIEEVREAMGPELMGRDAAYKFAKLYGIRLGRRYVVPRAKLEALQRGELVIAQPHPPMGKKIAALLTVVAEAMGKAEEGDMSHHAALLDIAKVCHETNRAYAKTLGDDSIPAWEDAPQWQRDSMVSGVQTCLQMFPQFDVEHMHNRWMWSKERDGWKYGPVKDPDKKEHPCMVPYDELPATQKAKDYLFIGVVHAFVKGFAVSKATR